MPPAPLWMIPTLGDFEGSSTCLTRLGSMCFRSLDGLVPFAWWNIARLSKAVPGARAVHS